MSFLKNIKDKIRQTKLYRGGSLRNIVKDIKLFTNMSISPQSIKNFLKIDTKKINKTGNRINQKLIKLSGYLTIDEQFLN